MRMGSGVMGIYVPSRGRAGWLPAKRTTISSVGGCTMVVPLDEKERYERVLRGMAREDVKVLACPEDGIAGTRLWIGQHAADLKLDKFLMIDDDLNFCVRKGTESYHLRPATKQDVLEMLAWTAASLDRHAHSSVSPRANNAGVPRLQSGDVSTLWQLNKRTLRYLAYRTKDFLSVEHGRVDVMEDFDVNLQLLETGRTNILSYWWAQDQRETGSSGGCSTYRTHEVHERSARRLHELHPQFVELREKENKSATSKHAAAFKKRTEVTIAWEKAAISGGYVKPKRERAA